MKSHEFAQKIEAIEKHINDIANDDIIETKLAQLLRQSWANLKEGIISAIGRGIYKKEIGENNRE